MVAAMTIVGRLILLRGRHVFVSGRVANHGYPVLITRPTVEGECVSGYRYGEGSHLVVGGSIGLLSNVSVDLSGVLLLPNFFLERLET